MKKVRIACIDTAKVLKAYKGIEELSASIENKNKTFKARLDTLASEFKAAVKDYEKKRPGLAEKERMEAELRLRQKQEAYAQFNASGEEGLKKDEMKVIAKALERINDKIVRYSKSKGYSVVFGLAPNNGVLYASDYIDITEDIISIINN